MPPRGCGLSRSVSAMRAACSGRPASQATPHGSRGRRLLPPVPLRLACTAMQLWQLPEALCRSVREAARAIGALRRHPPAPPTDTAALDLILLYFSPTARRRPGMIKLFDVQERPLGARSGSPVGSPRSPQSAKKGELLRLAKGAAICCCAHLVPLLVVLQDAGASAACCLAQRSRVALVPPPAMPLTSLRCPQRALPPHPQPPYMHPHCPATPALSPADISELDLPPSVQLSFPHGMEHLDLFEVKMSPGGCFFAWGLPVCMWLGLARPSRALARCSGGGGARMPRSHPCPCALLPYRRRGPLRRRLLPLPVQGAGILPLRPPARALPHAGEPAGADAAGVFVCAACFVWEGSL